MTNNGPGYVSFEKVRESGLPLQATCLPALFPVGNTEREQFSRAKQR